MRTSTIGVMKPTAYLIRLAPMRKPALSESDAIAAVDPLVRRVSLPAPGAVDLLPRGLVDAHSPAGVLKASSLFEHRVDVAANDSPSWGSLHVFNGFSQWRMPN